MWGAGTVESHTRPSGEVWEGFQEHVTAELGAEGPARVNLGRGGRALQADGAGSRPSEQSMPRLCTNTSL